MMAKNFQCQECGFCMIKNLVTEHKWLTGHKNIIERDVKEIAKEVIDCIHGIRSVHVKHESKSLEMFDHYRYMKAEAIVCHCDICEFVIRLLRAYENGDPYISKKMITQARRYK